MLNEIFEFFKNPEYVELNEDNKTKTRLFFTLTAITVAFSLLLGMLAGLITSVVGYDYEGHAVMDMFESYSPVLLFFLVVIVAPVIEEFIFRGPLGFFKNSKHFKHAFYTSVLLFGVIHIGNFQNIDGYYWLIPVLVAPQISAGIFLGFIRTKLGLVWSMLLHAAHNLILIGPFIIMKLLDIPFE